MNSRVLGISGSLLLVAVVIACGSEDNKRSGFGLGTDAGVEGGPPPFGGGSSGHVSDCAYNNQNPDDDEDHDGDGLSIKQGDCNDCNPGIRKGAHDIAGNGT